MNLIGIFTMIWSISRMSMKGDSKLQQDGVVQYVTWEDHNRVGTNLSKVKRIISTYRPWV